MTSPSAPLWATGKTHRRLKEPLPCFTTGLFEAFGCLTGSVLEAILADERWYGDGDPTWRDAPSAADAHAKLVKVAKSLKHHNYASVTGAAMLALIIGSCSLASRCGSHACPECGRADQRWLVDAVRKLLRQTQEGYDDFSFNFVMPEGQTRIEDICDAPFDFILGKCRTALDQCKAVHFAVIGIDTSANDDTAKFKAGRLKFGPKIYFQVHVYGIVRTSDRQAVWDALRHLFNGAANIYRPLKISSDPFDGAVKGISYVCKPDAFQHRPYLDKAGNWNTPIKPAALTPKQQVYYRLAMHNLGFARRIALVGLHPVITKSTKKKKSGVVLRKVFRGRSAM